MNKARRMAALQARALCEAGYAVLQIDLHGCGDSSGDFGDASWAGWVDDIVQAARWLRLRGPAPLWLWGLRAGCLLAAEAARRLDGRCDFLFWAPPPSGRVLLQQFLRLKLAGAMSGGDPRAAAEALRRQREAGLPVEVAGYTLAPGLCTGLERATLAPPAEDGAAAPGTPAPRLVWFELSSREEAALLPVSNTVLAAWRQAGFQVRSEVVRGPAFWQTVEIEDAPALIDATVAALAAADAARARGDSTQGGGPVSAARVCTADEASVPVMEEALVFGCGDGTLLGIEHRPALASSDTAVLVIVGGPQYRAGSHRQFVLLARRLAAAGHPVLRFDYRGMGDSSGELRDFRQVGPDIAAALDLLQRRHPRVRRFVLWGLCDAASAALLYLHDTGDARVWGLCLLNPWVRSPATLARTHVKHYYGRRLRQREFWLKLLRGQVALSALNELWEKFRTMQGCASSDGDALPFQARMARACLAHAGPVLLILSGEDYTAREFLEHSAADEVWRKALSRPLCTRETLAEADHTFSTGKARREVEALTLAWLAAHRTASPPLTPEALDATA